MDTLYHLGYQFKDGKLRQRKLTSNSFSGKKKPMTDDMQFELSQAIDIYVHKLLENEGLRKLPVPKVFCSTMLNTFIYASLDSLENDKLVILVNGCGSSVGQWSKHIIMNDDIIYGSQITYIKEAKRLGYGILLLNINAKLKFTSETLFAIQESTDDYDHFHIVWKDYIQDCKAKYIAIIAHEYGGEYIIRHGMIFEEQFKDRVFAIALLDCTCIPRKNSVLEMIYKSWTFSDVVLEMVKVPKRSSFMCISSDGDFRDNREVFPYYCMSSVFQYIQDEYSIFKKCFEVNHTDDNF